MQLNKSSPNSGSWWLIPLRCSTTVCSVSASPWQSLDVALGYAAAFTKAGVVKTAPDLPVCPPAAFLPLTFYQHIIASVLKCYACSPPTVPRHWTRVLHFTLPKHHLGAPRDLELKRCTRNNNCILGPPKTIWGSKKIRAMCCGCGQSAPEWPLRSGHGGQRALSKPEAFSWYRCCRWSTELSIPRPLPRLAERSHTGRPANPRAQQCLCRRGGSPASTETAPSGKAPRLVCQPFWNTAPLHPGLLFQAQVFKCWRLLYYEKSCMKGIMWYQELIIIYSRTFISFNSRRFSR